MRKYVNAYKILADACIKFCENNDCLYDNIVAEIFTDVLGEDYIFCKCVGNTFEFLTDWYEGGTLTIMSLDYFDNVVERGLAK